MMDFENIIRNKASEIFEEIRTIRRHIHRHPELSFQEKATSAFIKEVLNKYRIDYTDGWVGTGIVARINAKSSNKTIALRADMDALPIRETNEAEYASANEGIMHACGHDVHTACLLGAAIVLKSIASDLPHNVVCVFQPGEEKLPGGARLMLEEGALGQPLPDAIVGLHVHPPLAAGKVGLRAGMYMASADEIYITLKGKGGHAALPHECIDPILMASEVISGLQKLISRYANPTHPAVLTIGKINSQGGATNVIPDEVALEGTFRAMDESFRTKAHDIITKVVEGIAASFGGTAEVRIEKGYPCLINNEALTGRAQQVLKKVLGQHQVTDLPLRMTAEDFSYYSQVMPACFFRLGTNDGKGGHTSPVHTASFDIDENALKTGIISMASLAVYLEL